MGMMQEAKDDEKIKSVDGVLLCAALAHLQEDTSSHGQQVRQQGIHVAVLRADQVFEQVEQEAAVTPGGRDSGLAVDEAAVGIEEVEAVAIELGHRAQPSGPQGEVDFLYRAPTAVEGDVAMAGAAPWLDQASEEGCTIRQTTDHVGVAKLSVVAKLAAVVR